MIFKFIKREFVNKKSFSVFFIIHIAFGLTGFVSLDTLKRHFTSEISQSGKEFLGADIAVSARRPLTNHEITSFNASLPSASEKSELISIYTMARSEERTSLVQLRAIEVNYPLYGNFILETETNKDQIVKTKDKKNIFEDRSSIWIYPELKNSLGIDIGSTVSLGNQNFKVSAIVKKDAGLNQSVFSLAPRIYIARPTIDTLGLIQTGSTAWYTHLARVNEADLANLTEAISAKLKDPGIRIRNFESVGNESGGFIRYISDFLGLVSLIGLFLSLLGSVFLFQNYIRSKEGDIAVFLSLGLSHFQTCLTFAFLVIFLGTIGAALGCILGTALTPLLTQQLTEFSGVDLTSAKLSFTTILITLCIGGIGSFLVTAPSLRRVYHLNPAALFNEFNTPGTMKNKVSALYYIPAFVVFYLLSLWQSQSIVVSAIFVGGLLVSCILLLLFGHFSIIGLRKLTTSAPLAPRLAMTFLERHKRHSLTSIIAIGVGCLLLNIIPQTQFSILNDIGYDKGLEKPEFFTFDASEDQTEDYERLLKEMGATNINKSPIIRGRLSKKNGKTWERVTDQGFTREEQTERRFRNRGVNLSIRERFDESETIIEGKPFTKYTKGSIPEISLEHRYAKRIGVKLGEVLTFDIQGISFEGKVTSIRKIKWTSFKPNFFIIFQPGIIDDAPKTFIYAFSGLNNDKIKSEFQEKSANLFPNISIVDISRTISKLEEIIGKSTAVLNLMSVFCIIVGVIVLFSISQNQVNQRTKDINLMKVLGSQKSFLYTELLIEVCTTGFIAGSLGGFSGLAAGYLIGEVILNGEATVNYQIPLYIFIGTISVCLITSLLASINVFRKKPALYL
jgi:putative ABC transport system permease protein